MLQIIAIVGKSNSGKTTLLEKIIYELKTRGLKVGVIKHTPHEFDLDIPGKDSYRHKQAGAKNVMLLSPKQMALIKDICNEPLENYLHYFKDMDILFAEGFKNSKWPKIEVFRLEAHKHPVCLDDPNLLAIVSNTKLHTSVPQFKIKNILAISDFIEQSI